MPKLNCWESEKCGREPGGVNAQSLGVCPAVKNPTFHGANGGKNGGRICWFLSGTFCGGKVQGTYAQKAISCMNCEFFKQVQKEEGNAFVLNPEKQKTK